MPSNPRTAARWGRSIRRKSSPLKAGLTAESWWSPRYGTTGSGQNILEQTTRYVFSRHNEARMIDAIVTLHALDRAVFHDDKEGCWASA